MGTGISSDVSPSVAYLSQGRPACFSTSAEARLHTKKIRYVGTPYP